MLGACLHRGRSLIFVLAVVLCGFASMGRTYAAGMTFVVNYHYDPDTTLGCPQTQANPYCSLRNAINAANNDPGPDTITFDASVFSDNVGGLIYAHGDLPFVDAAQGITIDAGNNHIVIYKQVSDEPDLDWGLVFVSPNGEAAQNITVNNIGAEGAIYDAIQVCPAPNTQNHDCEAPASNITMTNVSGDSNGYSGIRILGSSISGVTLTGVSGTHSGTGIVVQAAGGTISDVTVDQSYTTHNTAAGLHIVSQDSEDSTVKGDINGVTINGFGTTKDGDTGVLIEGRAISDVSVDGLHSAYATAALAINQNQSASNVSITNANITLGNIGILFEQGGPDGSVDGATISDNDITVGEGIEVVADSVSNVTLENNFVHAGDVYGIHLYSIGTGGSGNVVKDNTITGHKAGVEVQGDGLKAAISQNTLYDNTGLGIDLRSSGDGPDQVTHNDPGDTDTGPNGLLNYPVITNVTPEALSGTACANCLIELFIATPDPTGYGEGDLFLRDGMTDGAGNFTISLCELELDAGTALTTTATDASGETSEFSLNFNLQQPTSTTCTVPTDTPSPTPTHSPTPTPTPSGSATPSPSPTPTLAPGQHKQGDLNCDGRIDAIDALLAVLAKFQLTLPAANGNCPNVGSGNPPFGDVNCDGVVNELDALAILAYAAGVPLDTPDGCTAIGRVLS